MKSRGFQEERPDLIVWSKDFCIMPKMLSQPQYIVIGNWALLSLRSLQVSCERQMKKVDSRVLSRLMGLMSSKWRKKATSIKVICLDQQSSTCPSWRGRRI